MKTYLRATLLLSWLSFPLGSLAQSKDSIAIQVPTTDFSEQRDVIYYAQRWLPWLHVKNQDSLAMPTGHIFAWILPSVIFEPHTRLAAYLGGNIAYRSKQANVSSIYPTLGYTQNNQLVFHTASTLWLPGNRFNITSDWRAMYYPQLTYGLGANTSAKNFVLLSYNYIRLYQSLSRSIRPNLYVGGGYSLDYHWNIQQLDIKGDEIATPGYDLTQSRSVSSGLTMNVLYDGRGNLLNPKAGLFANFQFRFNLQALGSNTNYQSMLIDVRKYIRLPAQSGNLLAFWSYNSLTLHGDPPYLDLPSTGWDATNNQGRGYIQGRFRSKNLLYAETEYRFRILRSGLLGGVAFANTHLVTEPITGQFSRLLPAGGAGIRVKLNKLSNVNFAADYAIGLDGSRSVYFNIGELF